MRLIVGHGRTNLTDAHCDTHIAAQYHLSDENVLFINIFKNVINSHIFSDDFVIDWLKRTEMRQC